MYLVAVIEYFLIRYTPCPTQEFKPDDLSSHLLCTHRAMQLCRSTQHGCPSQHPSGKLKPITLRGISIALLNGINLEIAGDELGRF